MTLSPELLEILVCPQTHASLVLDGDWLVSTDPATRLRYPIREEIPIMLVEEAETLSEQDWRDCMARHGVAC